jgi:two-component system sensor histidine kinase BaeS
MSLVPSHAPGTASTPATPTPRWHWPARFDSLRIKLFLAIAGANALLAVVTYLVFSWSFDQGFVEYLNRADEARLRPLIVRLAEGYQREGNWRWVTADRRSWFEFVRDSLGGPRPRRGDDAASAASPASGITAAPMPALSASAASAMPDPLLTIDPRLMLFDADKKFLAGRDEMARAAILKPIHGDAGVVGYLGYVPQQRAVASLEKAFSAQQNHKFTAIGIGMLAAGLLIGALLANWLSLRIRRLAQGADALIQGHYEVRIEAHGRDELAQLAQDFNHLAQTLEAAQRARQQWIADIAHELRTPLAVLRAEIEALQDGVRPLGQASLGSLAQEVAQLARLVEDLRLLSLSDMGALTYHKEPLDLGELVEDCVATHTHALRDKGIAVNLALALGIEVVGDGSRLAQVFGNLLQNTVRYTDAPGRLDISLQADGRRARLIWQDSSPGVPAADLPRLTERLFRVDSSRSRAGGGSGLGLAITKAIVQAHGGEMAADASPLGGVRWTLSFPRVEASAPRSAHTKEPHG